MKNLFINNGLTWSKEAEEIVREAKIPLRSIMEKWVGLGYSARDIAHILFWASHDVELDTIIEHAEKFAPPKVDGSLNPSDNNNNQQQK